MGSTVEDMIAALPEQSDVTLDDKPSIEAARAAYDGLEAVDKERSPTTTGCRRPSA